MKWTKAYRKTHGKELMYDSALEFEKKREEPVKYKLLSVCFSVGLGPFHFSWIMLS